MSEVLANSLDKSRFRIRMHVSGGTMIYEVDILIQEPITKLVEAETLEQAREMAEAGKGVEKPGVHYSYGEVVDVREASFKD